MVRRFVLAASAALAASGFALAPSAAADGQQPQPSYNGDVPGINYEAYLSAPCFQWERFIFGRGPDGQALACHWIPNQGYLGWGSPSPPFTGFWVISPKLYGVGGRRVVPRLAGRRAVPGRTAHGLHGRPGLAGRRVPFGIRRERPDRHPAADAVGLIRPQRLR